MRKVVLVIVGLVFASVCFAGRGDAAKHSAKSDDYQKKIDNLYKRAAYYRGKAAQEPNRDLATIYAKCAEAKQKMADGYTKINESSQTYEAMMEKCGENGKSSVRMSAKELEKGVESCWKKAKQANMEGKGGLGDEYNAAAATLSAQKDATELVKKGKKEFKAARKELRTTMKELEKKKKELEKKK